MRPTEKVSTSSETDMMLWRHGPIDDDDDVLDAPDGLRSRLSVYRLRLHAGRLRELGYAKQFASLMGPLTREQELRMLRGHYRVVKEEQRRCEAESLCKGTCIGFLFISNSDYTIVVCAKTDRVLHAMAARVGISGVQFTETGNLVLPEAVAAGIGSIVVRPVSDLRIMGDDHLRLFVCGACAKTIREADACVCNCCAGSVFCRECNSCTPVESVCRFRGQLDNTILEITRRRGFPFVAMCYPKAVDNTDDKPVMSVPITIWDALRMPALGTGLLDGLSVRASAVTLEHPHVVAARLMRLRTHPTHKRNSAAVT